MASPNTDVAETFRQMEKRIENLTVRVKEAEDQRDRSEREMNNIQEEREVLERRLKEQDKRRESQRGTQQRVIHSTSLGIHSRPPKLPSLASKVSSWEKRMSLFLQTQGLGYTIRHSTNPVPIINNDDRESFVYRYGEQTVTDHEKVWGLLLDATTDASFEQRLLAAHTLEEAWLIIIEQGIL